MILLPYPNYFILGLVYLSLYWIGPAPFHKARFHFCGHVFLSSVKWKARTEMTWIPLLEVIWSWLTDACVDSVLLFCF